jgi:hypothetical protein
MELLGGVALLGVVAVVFRVLFGDSSGTHAAAQSARQLELADKLLEMKILVAVLDRRDPSEIGRELEKQPIYGVSYRRYRIWERATTQQKVFRGVQELESLRFSEQELVQRRLRLVRDISERERDALTRNYAPRRRS